MGWHYGFQETPTRFYMCNSAILPNHRRKGLYQQLMTQAIEMITGKGFQEIYSRHKATNNAVIIPKLKAGFIITSLQVEDVLGALIHLTYYPKKIREKILAFRVGHIRADDEIRSLLKL